MSKEAALRAMREARYAERAAGFQRSASKPARPVARPDRTAKVTSSAEAAVPAEAPAEVGAEAAVESLCGHRSMNGRTCTREQGHAAKNHRYS